MKTINAIIVDDETDAREVLNSLLQMSKYHINVVANCENVPDAVLAIKKHKPDVVFLDVQMPNYAGYEIVKFFDEINFEIIFVTAYDQYAIKAFELSAIDYLVKPVSRDRLNSTLLRLSEKVEENDSIIEYQILLDTINKKESQKIVIPEASGKKIIVLNDIICIKGEGSYSTLYLKNNERLTVSKNLKYLENTLPSDSFFFRSQKSWLININEIEAFNLSKGDLTMSNQIKAKISVNRVEEFKFILQKDNKISAI
jgi:two-component system LytT family response regulator